MRKISKKNIQKEIENNDLWFKSNMMDGKIADLSNCILKNANFEGVNLSCANLEGADLFGANLNGANLANANLRNTNLSGANIAKANLSGINLERSNLSYANISGSVLIKANISRAKIERGVLEKANLENANLEGSYLFGSNLKEANLRLSNLKDTNLQSSNLLDANLELAILNGADITNCLITKNQLQDSATGSKIVTDNKTNIQKVITRENISAEFIHERNELKRNIEELTKQLEIKNQDSKQGEKLQKKIKELNLTLKSKEEQFEIERTLLTQELENERKEKEKTKVKINKSLDQLSKMLKYKEQYLQWILFIVYLVLSAISIIIIVKYEQNKFQSFLAEIKNNTNSLFFFASIGPIILCLSLFGTFLTQANRTYRNITEILDKKEIIQKLRGALDAKIELAEQSNLRQTVIEINEIMDKFIHYHLFSNNGEDNVIELAKNKEKEEVDVLNHIIDIKNKVTSLAKK